MEIKDNTLFPMPLKMLISVFLVVLSVGYFSALFFVNETTSSNATGIIENYNGNENNEEAEEMKFKKSKHEMLNIIHTHILSMSVIFFILALLVYTCNIHPTLKTFLMVEPLISVLLTFGGIFLIWNEVEWMTYIVMLSGGLMTASFIVSILTVYYSMFLKTFIK